jgi:phospholipid/cholesterol/gamma-HCH transport system substrate-binding protein
MISRAERARLGIFLFVAIGLMVLAVSLLAGYHFTRERDMYTVRFTESVSGLEVGAQVKYNGVRIGQIIDIEIDRSDLERVIATLEVRHRTPVKVDSEAVLVSMGITGLRFVELTGGSKRAKLLNPGDEIPSGKSLMGTLEGKAEDIAVRTELALDKINRVLSDKNIRGVHDIVVNMSDITGDVADLLKENKQNITKIIGNVEVTSRDLKQTMASLNRSTERLEGVITESEPKVGDIMDNLSATAKDFRKAGKSLARIDNILKDIAGTLGRFNGYLKDVDLGALAGDAQVAVSQAKEMLKSMRRLVDASRGDIYQSSKSLKKTLRNLEVLSSDLKEQPSLLLRSKPQEERTPEERK